MGWLDCYFFVVCVSGCCSLHCPSRSASIGAEGQSLIFHEHSTFPFHKAESRVSHFLHRNKKLLTKMIVLGESFF